jgi:AraC-like DNA-binding protein
MSWDDVVLTADRALTDHIQVRAWEHHTERPCRGPVAAHPAIEITWVESGRVAYRIGGQELQVAAGSTMIVPRGVEHATDFVAAGQVGSVRLSAEMVGEVADAIGPMHRGCRLTHGMVRSSRLLSLGRLIASEAELGGAGQLLAVEALSEALAVELLRSEVAETSDAAQSDPRIDAALDQIASCYSEALTVDDLARTAGMSRFHFSRRFRRVVGKSPYQFLLETRLAQAAALLRRGHHSVTSAALSVGFNDLGRFSRMFRAWASQTPEEYRRERGVRITHKMAQTA